MASRLIELVVPREVEPRVKSLIEDLGLAVLYRAADDGRVLFRLLIDAEDTEGVLDRVRGRLTLAPEHRLVVLSVDAVIPPLSGPGAEPAPPDAEPGEAHAPDLSARRTIGRLSRDELLEDAREASRVTRNYLIFTALATVVAAVGLAKSSPAIVIGAMVIAPLLGPNIALSLATAVADHRLALGAARANAVGFAIALGLSVAIGLTGAINLSTPEIASRTSAGWGDLTLAVASGAAGAMAFSSGLAASLVGVMVAVALLPPTVVVGLALGAGAWDRFGGAALLLATNVVSINLAGVGIFVCQGIRPGGARQRQGGSASGLAALLVWVALLAALAVLIAVSRG